MVDEYAVNTKRSRFVDEYAEIGERSRWLISIPQIGERSSSVTRVYDETEAQQILEKHAKISERSAYRQSMRAVPNVAGG